MSVNNEVLGSGGTSLNWPKFWRTNNILYIYKYILSMATKLSLLSESTQCRMNTTVKLYKHFAV